MMSGPVFCWCGKQAYQFCAKPEAIASGTLAAGYTPPLFPLCNDHAPQYDLTEIKPAQFGPEEQTP